ncbi:MAG: hypothetical protein J1E60_05870 [Christensenellaceae bacterium]|nr:hypothetical protein [Christensenellaceae bacterium]
MTVSQLINRLGLTVYTSHDRERNVIGCYVGDLLSWVMGHAPKGCAWVTIMSNINVAAVAELTDASCVILAEGVVPDDDLIDAAKRHGINILSSDKTAFAVCEGIAKQL